MLRQTLLCHGSYEQPSPSIKCVAPLRQQLLGRALSHGRDVVSHAVKVCDLPSTRNGPPGRAHDPKPVRRIGDLGPDTLPGGMHGKPAHRHSSMEIALSKYIITAIKQASCWQDLEALLQAYPARTFNHIHLSALVCRLPKLVQPARLPPAERSRFARFLGHVSDAVSLALPTFDPRAIANTLWAVCKLGYSPAPPLLNKFLFEAYVRMDQFNAQELANLSWALATLAAMGNRPVPAWMLRFTQAAQGHVLALKPQELAHTAWALSKLCPSAPSPQGDTPAAHTPGSSTCSATPATPSYGSSSSQPAPPPSASSPATAAAAPPASGSPEGTGGHPAQLVAALTSRALDMACRDAFAPGELVTSLLALHNLDPRAGRTLLLPALIQLVRRGQELSPQDLANLWSVAMRHCAPSAPDTTASTARESGGQDESQAHGRAKRHSRAAALRSQAKESWDAWAAASSGALPGRHHLYALVELTEVSLHAHTAQGLCAVLVAWVQLQVSPSDQGVEALYGRLSQVLPSQATFQGVSVVLWASARLQLRPPNELMHTLLTCARLQAPTAKPRDLVAMAWALQQLRYRPPAGFFPALTARIRAPGLLQQLHPYGVHVLLSLYVMCDLEVPAELQEVALAVAAPPWSQPRPVGPHALTSAHPSVAARFVANLCGLGLPRLAEKPEAAATRSVAKGKGGRVGAGAQKEVGQGQGKEEGSVSEGSLALRRSMRWRLNSNPQLRERLRASVEAATLGRMQQLNHDTFCALVNAFARLRMRPSEAFLGEVHREANARAAALAPWQAAILVRALGRLGARPPPEVLSGLIMAIGEGMGELTGPQLLLLLRGLAQLRYRPPADWMKVLFFRCMKSHKDWPARDLHGFVRDLATLGLQLPSGSRHCRQLRLAVYRKKLPKEPRREMLAKARVLMLRAAKERRGGRGRAGKRGEGGRGRRGIDLGAGEDMKAQLCRVCVGLSGCPV